MNVQALNQPSGNKYSSIALPTYIVTLDPSLTNIVTLWSSPYLVDSWQLNDGFGITSLKIFALEIL